MCTNDHLTLEPRFSAIATVLDLAKLVDGVILADTGTFGGLFLLIAVND